MQSTLENNVQNFASKYPSSRDVRNIFFISVRFFEKTRIRFGMSLVRFRSKTRFGSDIIVIYYSCNS